MNLTKKHTYPKVFGVLVAVYAVFFFIYYLVNYLAYDAIAKSETLFNTLENIRYFLYEGAEFAVPVIIAMLTMLCYFGHKVWRGILLSVVLALSKSTYNLFYFYLYHTAFGYDWLESILGSILVTLGYGIIEGLYSALLAAIAYRVARAYRIKPDDLMKKAPLFDFSSGVTKSIFSICISHFAVELILEVIDAISFFSDYGDTYNLGEIFFMTACFIFLPVMLIISLALTVKLKNSIVIQKNITVKGKNK